MKIDKIIFSIDDNPLYSGLWEINSEICKKVIGVTPVLFHICEEDSDFIEDQYGLIKKVKRIPDLPTGFQSQNYRMYGTKFFENECCLTSDIDMLILNKEYFFDSLYNINENDLIIYSSDAYESNRPECVGIYSGDRYPICYNLGKGSTFNKILNTDCSFDDYIKQILSHEFPNHDSDELYFGYCVNNKNHNVKVHKLKRGYVQTFRCHNRIDRVNDNFFNEYDKSKLVNGEYVDIHLSRPYSKYKNEINEIRNILIDDKKEVYLIGCHIENEDQLSLLKELIEFLEKNNKKFVLSSHTLIPEDIIKKSVGFVYDSINPKYKVWDLPGYFKSYYETEFFIINSPYISYGASDYYHIGAIRLVINGIKYIQNLDYNIIHWVEYDSLPNLSMDENANKLLTEDNDFIFYGIGTRFSFLKSKVNNKFINSTNGELFDLLSKNNYLAEKVLGDNLSSGKKCTIFLDEKDRELWGRYSQNFNNTKLNWSLFENGNEVNIFLANISNQNIKLCIEYNGITTEINLSSNQWVYRGLDTIDKIGKFKLLLEEKVIVDVDLSNKINYNKLIKVVEFIKK